MDEKEVVNVFSAFLLWVVILYQGLLKRVGKVEFEFASQEKKPWHLTQNWFIGKFRMLVMRWQLVKIRSQNSQSKFDQCAVSMVKNTIEIA